MYRYLLLLCLFLTVPAAAQPVLIFESDPGFRLTELGELVPTVQGRFDYNGDGVRDLSMIRGDGLMDSLFVFDLTTKAPLLQLSLNEVKQAMGSQNLRLVGYFDINGSAPKEIAFYDKDARVLGLTAQIDGQIQSKQGALDTFVLPAHSFALLDLDGDDRAELIVGNPETETVQVYGSSTGTATEDAIEVALAPLLEYYPNPFREATTIAYEVHQAGPVTITVYDLLGRAITTLVDARQAVGRHQVRWDGRNAAGQPLAAGAYFYQLRVNEATSSKQAIRIR